MVKKCFVYTMRAPENRVVFIDRMEVLPDGTLVVHGPTTMVK